MFAGIEDDVLYGDVGNDSLNADAGDDLLFGGKGHDQLSGGIGDDSFVGEEGNDILAGLSGNDTLTGNAGSDRFVLATEGTNYINDFNPDEDLLELPENINLDNLQIIQSQDDNADNVLVNFQSETIAVLKDTNLANIFLSNFTYL